MLYLALALTALQSGALQRSDESLAPLVTALSALRDARVAGRSEDDARRALEKVFEADSELLARPRDLGRALALAERRGQARPSRGGKVETVDLDSGSFAARPFAVAYRVPKGPQPENGYPVLLTLPAAGESPVAHIQERFAARGALESALVIAPALPEGAPNTWTEVAVAGRPGGVAHALAALRHVRERIAIDPDRVVIVARATTAAAGLALADHAPHLFAGLALVSADALTAPAHNLRNVGVLLAGGGTAAQTFRAELIAQGFELVDELVVVDDARLVQWALERRRRALPVVNSVVVGNPYPTRVGWLRVAPNAVETTARAAVDRNKNSIQLLASGASAVTLHLSDALLDLNRPVLIDFEGRSTPVLVKRSAVTFVDRWLDGTSDPGAPYVAELVLAPTVGPIVEERTTAALDPEYEVRLPTALQRSLEEQKGDALWELVIWCRATGRSERERALCAKILRIEPDHAGAREALGHVRAPGTARIEWFRSVEARDLWVQRQTPAIATSLGHIEHAGRWLHPSDRDVATTGAVQDPESGVWLTLEDQRRIRRGYALQDLAWIEPESVGFADEGLWRVGGEWLTLGEANRRHADLASPWRIPTWHTQLITTVDREVAERALTAMRDTLPALHHVFGIEPRLPVRVALLRDEEQYDRFAFGDPDGRRAATHTARLHTVHSAFFAESWFARTDGVLGFHGAGVGYWDALAPNGDAYGFHAARLAFAFAYVDALDPSPKAVQKALPKGPSPGFADAYEREKQLPRWLRLGAAVYAERWFVDHAARERGADPQWARTWSRENLERLGGARPIDVVLRTELNPDQRLEALRGFLEAGALVAFIVDGGVEPVAAAYQRVREALRVGRIKPAELRALQDVLLAHGDAYQRFARGE